MENKIATIGIFAHANAGKTTITEHLLYHTGVIKDIGRVDSGSTVTDNLSIEKERGISVRDTLVSFELDGKKIQLIDTPGHIDFSSEVERAISVLDAAILVISGVDGLEAQTFTIWRALKEKNIPIIIFINKMDRLGANYKKVIEELHEFLNVPTLTLTQVSQDDKGTLIVNNTSEIERMEEVALIDDEMLEMYVNQEKFNEKKLYEKIAELIKSGKLFPIIGGSALIDIGINDLIYCLNNFIPYTTRDKELPLSGFVYAIRIEENEKNAYIKILDGIIKIKDTIKLPDDKIGKVNNMYIAIGSERQKVDQAYNGDIVIVNGLDVKSGDVIGEGKIDKQIKFVNPLLSMEISPSDQKDSIKLMESLRILNEEDPHLNVRFNEKTNSIQCSLMGDVQAQIIKSYLEDRFNLDAIIRNPVIIHKETPTIEAIGKASYTSVSGITLKITPLERGTGFKYVSQVSTDFLHIKYQKQIERLISVYSQQGLFGWELTDMEVSLIEGQFDSVGSDPLHFNIVTPLALFRALKEAKVKLLEPISKFIITTPSISLNNVTRLLSTKMAIYQVKKNYEDIVTLEGEVPAVNFLDFPVELSKITSGRGTISSYISKYEISNNSEVKIDYLGADPRNETTFIINDMKVGLEPLDKKLYKKKKESKGKFAQRQIERKKEIAEKMKIRKSST